MSATLSDRELLKQLRDALVRSNNALNVLTATNHQHDAEIIAAADARLVAPEWIAVSDALPVVPEGHNAVCLWVTNGDMVWATAQTHHSAITENSLIIYWRYRYVEPSPTPPEVTK